MSEREPSIEIREIVDSVHERLSAEGRARLSLPGGGRLHVDRPLPVLALHRSHPGDRGTADLVLGQASYLISGADTAHEDLRTLIGGIVEPFADRFGAFLTIELWGAPEPPPSGPLPSPVFRIYTDLQEGEPPAAASALRDGLSAITAFGPDPSVELVPESIAPPRRDQILTDEQRRDLGCLSLGLEVPPVYRNGGGDLYPEILREATQQIAGVLHQVFFTFAQVHTSYEPEDFRELGRKIVISAGWEVDSKLSNIAKRLDFLLNVTPVNAEAEWASFRASGFSTEPQFHYRPLTFDPDLAKRRLFGIEIERVEDPTITFLLREKRNELDRLITMLEDRETPRFLQESVALYGGVEGDLLAEARAILEISEPEDPSPSVSADLFADRAAVELEAYRRRWSSFEGEVEVRSDIPGVMVVHGALMVGADTQMSAHRVEPLIHHEIGTHMLTGQNGATQSLKMLAVGLPGHEETQEGLAVFSEFISGGLGVDRLRVLAGRVLAVHRLLEGAGFVQVFRELHEEHGFEPRVAWSMTMRVFRSGGLTKDAVYLRGLRGILAYLHEGGPLEPLFVGKMALEHVPMIEELLWRDILVKPPLHPRWLEMDGTPERVGRVRDGATVLDLVEGRAR